MQPLKTMRDFDFLNPKIEDIEIEDIATALSKICRFNGHCSIPFSVAEHSVYVSKYLEAQDIHRDFARVGLLHDAAEAYIGDMVTPLKVLFPEFSALENRILKLVFAKYFPGSLVDHYFEIMNLITNIDKAAAATEARYLCGSPAWSLKLDELKGYGPIIPMKHEKAYQLFMNRFYELWTL